MSLQNTLQNNVKKAITTLYQADLETVEFQATRKEFAGDITVVVFPMLRVVKGNPVQIGEAIGNYLVENVDEVKAFNVVKGFLNIEISDTYYLEFFNTIKNNNNFGIVPPKKDGKAVMVEYSSPNTNKPLHLGHIRNNLLGYSVAEIVKASGKKVYKTQIINDRGIHICKSMLAWQRYGNSETPESTGLKGDKLVGNYYVKFDQEYKKELKGKINNITNIVLQVLNEQISEERFFLNKALIKFKESKDYFDVIKKSLIDYLNYREESINLKYEDNDNYDIVFSKFLNHVVSENIVSKVDDLRNEFFVNYGEWMNLPSITLNDDAHLIEKYYSEKKLEKVKSFIEGNSIRLIEILHAAQQMLQKWEAGDKEVVALWETMNGWVYKGFDVTYKNLGVDFDTLYYESQTYLLGKEFVEEGLRSGVFIKKEDGSVWCDLTDDGLDEKIVLRSDGTAVYMTQDIGTAIQRLKDFPDVGGMVYTVGNEQDYHFKVLFLILKKLGFDWAKNLFHLSYGMVDLPSGKMKSREGTVVDADDLISEMASTAKEISEDLGKLEGYSDEEKQELYKTIGLGALKYYILKVDPKKRILFDPKDSIDFQGNTGPFIQYTYARIQSILRKAKLNNPDVMLSAVETSINEKERELIKQLELFPEIIQSAAEQHSPALIANYTYELVKEFNSFYQNVSILGADNNTEKTFRVQLSQVVANTIKNAFGLLGINVPERM